MVGWVQAWLKVEYKPKLTGYQPYGSKETKRASCPASSKLLQTEVAVNPKPCKAGGLFLPYMCLWAPNAGVWWRIPLGHIAYDGCTPSSHAISKEGGVVWSAAKAPNMYAFSTAWCWWLVNRPVSLKAGASIMLGQASQVLVLTWLGGYKLD